MNDLIKINQTNAGVITLKEITDILEVRHNDAMDKVEKLSLEPSFGELRETRISHIKGKSIKTYCLTKLQAIAVGAKLNNALLMKLVIHLEKATKPMTEIELARKHLANLERIEALQIENNNLELTKAHINNKKTATAMNTASQAVKKANKLEIELDKAKDYCTIKRMTMLNHGQVFSFKLLRDTANEMDIPRIDIYDANYGTVKAYHKSVWLEAYGLEF